MAWSRVLKVKQGGTGQVTMTEIATVTEGQRK